MLVSIYKPNTHTSFTGTYKYKRTYAVTERSVSITKRLTDCLVDKIFMFLVLKICKRTKYGVLVYECLEAFWL